MFPKYYDKIIFGSSLLFVLLLSLFFFQSFDVDEQKARVAGGAPRAIPYEPTPVPSLVYETEKWDAPPINPANPDWTFDVFTPPLISFNPSTGVLEITPENPEERSTTPFLVDLIGVRPELYRVQLSGYLGVQGDYLITLTNREDGAMVAARKGRVLDEVEIEVLDLEVVREQTAQTDHEYALATIRDLRTGETIVLRSDQDNVLDSHVAVLRTRTSPPRVHEVKEGGSITVSGERYTVERFQLTPPQATVSKTSPQITGKDTQRLHVERPGSPVSAGRQARPGGGYQPYTR